MKIVSDQEGFCTAEVTTNLVQQALDTIGSTTFNQIPQILQQILIVLRFFREFLNLPKICKHRSATLFIQNHRPKNHLPLRPFLPSNRILTSNPQLPTLPTNRGIATTLRLALPARFASAGNPPIISWRNARPLTGNSNLRQALRTIPARIRICFGRSHARSAISYRDGFGEWRRSSTTPRDKGRHWFLCRQAFAGRVLRRFGHSGDRSCTAEQRAQGMREAIQSDV